MNCLKLITRAMRIIGVVAGGDTPQEAEAADALETLIGIYRRMITEGTFGELSDAIPTTDYTACENQRVIRNSISVGDITLPDTINDNGSIRPPRDGSVIIITDVFSNTTNEYIYDGAVKSWVALTDLQLTSNAPLVNRDLIGLAAILAIELAPEYGQQPDQFTVQNAARFNMGLTHNWSNPQTITPGVYF